MLKKIPLELIQEMPDGVTKERDVCEKAADDTLKVLFFMAAEIAPVENFPLIISNGVEVWPLPAPWISGERRPNIILHDLNGTEDEGGYLTACKRNAEEYNKLIEEGKDDPDALDKAKEVAKLSAGDSAHVWSYLNALVASTTTENVYQTLELSDETGDLYAEITQEPA